MRDGEGKERGNCKDERVEEEVKMKNWWKEKEEWGKERRKGSKIGRTGIKMAEMKWRSEKKIKKKKKEEGDRKEK